MPCGSLQFEKWLQRVSNYVAQDLPLQYGTRWKELRENNPSHPKADLSLLYFT
jgi:hypothetical protein